MKKLTLLIGIICVLAGSNLFAQGWKVLKAPIKADITGINFIDSEIGFIVGKNGKIARTDDACRNWLVVQIDDSIRIEDVSFLDTKNGLICGEKGVIYKTTDGGKTWVNITPGDTGHYYFDIDYLDKQTAMVVGLDRLNPNPMVGVGMITFDTGKSWKKIDAKGMGFSGISKINNDIYFIGFGIVIHSKDNGKTWDHIKTNISKPGRALAFSGNNGIIAGPQGMCAYTSDRGKTWKTTELPMTNTFICAKMIDSTIGYIGGTNSLMKRTNDGGISWNDELLAKSFHVIDMCYIGNRIYAVGSEGTIIYKEL